MRDTQFFINSPGMNSVIPLDKHPSSKTFVTVLLAKESAEEEDHGMTKLAYSYCFIPSLKLGSPSTRQRFNYKGWDVGTTIGPPDT